MKKTQIISEDKNHKAIDIGSFEDLSGFEFHHPKFSTVDPGRLFIGEILETTGSEISFRELPAKTKIGFLHKHKKHEEVYIFLKGAGRFQVDEEVFKVQEGSIVRVSPEGNRTLSNDSERKMVYMVIQAQAGTLNDYNVLDGYRTDGEVKIKDNQ